MVDQVRDLEVVEIEGCYARKETKPGKKNDGGLLVILPNDDEAWFPKSQIHEDSEVYKEGTNGKLVVAKFIADERVPQGIKQKVRWLGP